MRRKGRTRQLVAGALVGAALALAAAGGTSASHAHPFCGSGQEYAQSHIVPLAEASGGSPTGGLGAADGHVPGFHQGFSVCLDIHE